MSRQRSKWMTAGLLAATLGLWGAAFIAPEFHLDRNDVSDCRGLGVAAIVLLGFWLMIVPVLGRIVDLLRQIRKHQTEQQKAWSFYSEGAAAARGHDPGGLWPVIGDRNAS